MTMGVTRMHISGRAVLMAATSLALAVGALTLPQATAATASATPPTHVNDCWSTDKVPPVIDSFDVTPSSADTSSGPVEVQLTVGAHDVGGPGPASGIGGIEVLLGSAEGADIRAQLSRGSDGLWHGSAELPARTTASYDAQVLAHDRSAQGTLTVQRDHTSTRSFLDVVQTTGAPPPSSDTQAPKLTELTLSTNLVNTRRHSKNVEVTATVTDDDSGVSRVTIGLNAIGKPSNQIPDRSVTLTRVAGTDTYRGRLHYQRWIGDHYDVLSVLLSDVAGNGRRTLHHRLLLDGFPSSIEILSGPPDDQGPRVVHVPRAARTVDVRRQGRSYRIGLAMADPQGVTKVDAILTGLDLRWAHLRRITGSVKRGVWIGRLRVPRCLLAPATSHLRVVAYDGHGLGKATAARTVRILSPDHVPPTTTHITWRVRTPVFRFTEPVYGISSANVQVYDDDTSSGPNPMSGSWKCRDAKRHRVSCRTGSVLRATFYPDDSTTRVPGVVDWEPGLHLDVLDAHGNPFISGSVSPDVND
jgi:hypothetical protein